MLSVARITVFVILAWMCAAPRTFAQAVVQSDAVFGRENARVGATRSVNLLMSVSTGLDNDISAEQGGVSSLLVQNVQGQYSDLDGAFSFVRADRRWSMAARASGALRHYPELGGFVGSSRAAGADLTVAVSRRTTLHTRVDGNYVSGFAFDAFSRAAAGPSDPAIGGSASDWIRSNYGGSADVVQLIGRRSSLGIGFNTRYSEQPTLRDQANEKAFNA